MSGWQKQCNRCNQKYDRFVFRCPNCGCPEFRLPEAIDLGPDEREHICDKCGDWTIVVLNKRTRQWYCDECRTKKKGSKR